MSEVTRYIGKTARFIEGIAQSYNINVRKNTLSDGSKTFDVVIKDTEFEVACIDELAAEHCRSEIAAAIYRATR